MGREERGGGKGGKGGKEKGRKGRKREWEEKGVGEGKGREKEGEGERRGGKGKKREKGRKRRKTGCINVTGMRELLEKSQDANLWSFSQQILSMLLLLL